MGVRFNKKITVFPWLKMNVGKSGISLTIGPKGKTLNVNKSGISINVNLGQGMGYSKRILSWKGLNLPGLLGIGGAAAAKGRKSKADQDSSGSKSKKSKTKKGPVTVPTLDEAIAEAQAEQQQTPAGANSCSSAGISGLADERGCSWGCAAVGCLALLLALALVGVALYLLWQSGLLASWLSQSA